MFKNLLRQLDALQKSQELSFTIEPDENGFIDKECPNSECTFQFKTHAEDWQNLFQDSAVYCPFCRNEAPSDQWFTTEQVEMAKSQALGYVESVIGQAMLDDARDFNSKQRRNSFISMKLTVTGVKTHFIQVPIPSMEEMTLKIQCEKCCSRYAVIGSAFFCPCCGNNSVERTFDDSLLKVEAKLNNLNVIRQALIQAGLRDEAETTCRSLVETSLSDCVVAFQRYMEEVYKKQPNAEKVGFNAFQRIDDGSEYWERLTTKGYKDWLNKNELDRLSLLFQRRHLLAHTEGMVDDKYLLRSGDISYKSGQRIVVNEKDVRELLTYIRKIVSQIALIRTV